MSRLLRLPLVVLTVRLVVVVVAFDLFLSVEVTRLLLFDSLFLVPSVEEFVTLSDTRCPETSFLLGCIVLLPPILLADELPTCISLLRLYAAEEGWR